MIHKSQDPVYIVNFVLQHTILILWSFALLAKVVMNSSKY